MIIENQKNQNGRIRSIEFGDEYPALARVLAEFMKVDKTLSCKIQTTDLCADRECGEVENERGAATTADHDAELVAAEKRGMQKAFDMMARMAGELWREKMKIKPIKSMLELMRCINEEYEPCSGAVRYLKNLLSDVEKAELEARHPKPREGDPSTNITLHPGACINYNSGNNTFSDDSSMLRYTKDKPEAND